jgi:hypothetical protein
MPEVQESQGFKTLRNNPTADLKRFCIMITQSYALKANNMNVKAKRARFYAAICKWIRGLAHAFIAQQGINKYNEDVTMMDLIATAQDNIPASLTFPLPKFLAAYKAANNLQGRIPTPTIPFNFKDEINRVNGTPPLEVQETNQNVIVVHPAAGNRYNILNGTKREEEEDLKQEMIYATDAIETIQVTIGGRFTISRLIHEAIQKGTIKPIQKNLPSTQRE